MKAEFGDVVELDDAVDSVTFVSDWAHITTNGQFRAFLRDGRLGALWSELCKLPRANLPEMLETRSRWLFHLVYFRNVVAAETLLLEARRAAAALADGGGDGRA